MGQTLIARLGDLTIANGGVNSTPILHQEYADADALTFFCPAGLTSVTIQCAYDELNLVWFTLITGTSPVTITTSVAIAVSVIPPGAKAFRVVAGGAVSGDKTIQVNKQWGMRPIY